MTAHTSRTGMTSKPVLAAITILVSSVVGVSFLDRTFGARNVFVGLSHSNVAMVGIGVILGGLILLVRAGRARTLLSHEHPVRLGDTFHSLAIGHGLGDLLPVVPGGLIARSALSERLSGLSAPFAAGVFMFEGMLDGISPAILIGYLMFAVSLPGWTRWVLAAALCQSVLCVGAPALGTLLQRRIAGSAFANRRLAFLSRLAGQLAAGIGTLSGRGLRIVVSILGFSLLVATLEGVQLVVFLHAFGLTASVNDLLLILVLTLAGNSVPINIPGSGTVMLTGVLALAQVHGPGLAAYVLVTRFVSSTETAMIALTILAWWSARRGFGLTLPRHPRLHFGRGNKILVPVPVQTAIQNRLPRR